MELPRFGRHRDKPVEEPGQRCPLEQKRRWFTRTFKLEAFRLVTDEGGTNPVSAKAGKVRPSRSVFAKYQPPNRLHAEIDWEHDSLAEALRKTE